MKKIILALCLLAFIGCTQTHEPKFQKGEIVIIKLTGEKGMVTWMDYYNNPTYGVRISGAKQKTTSGLFYQDTRVEIYPVVDFKEFELMKAD